MHITLAKKSYRELWSPEGIRITYIFTVLFCAVPLWNPSWPLFSALPPTSWSYLSIIARVNFNLWPQESHIPSQALLCQVKSLYDPRYETYNVHCLLHLADRVFDLGPLWTHSCFCYEDFNGELRSCFHGTQSVEYQIALAVCIQMKIPELVPLLPQGSSSKHLYDKMTRKNQEPFNKLCIDDSGKMFSVGTVNEVSLSTVDQAILETLVGSSISQVFKFHRVQLGDKLIHCKEYRCMSRRNNYTVEFLDPKTKKISYGQVEYYLKCVVDCPNPSYLCSGMCLSATQACCNGERIPKTFNHGDF